MSQGEILQEAETLRIWPRKKGPHVVNDTLNQSFPLVVSPVSWTVHVTHRGGSKRNCCLLRVYCLLWKFSPTISTELTIFPWSAMRVEFKSILSVMYA